MAIDLLLPKVGFAMAEGTLAEWLVTDGASVTEGQAVYSLESEKSVTEVEAPASGVLKIVLPAGSTCKVGDRVGTIE